MSVSTTYLNILGQKVAVSGASTNWVGSTTALTMTGGAGDDSIYGNGYADTLIGDGGDDIFYVYNSATTVVEKAGSGTSTVIATSNYALPTNVANLTLTGAKTYGEGNSAANLIISDATGQYIDGEGGNDVLVGGSGDDTFVFSKGVGSDAIYGFQTAKGDVLRLQGFGTSFTSFSQVEGAMTQEGSDVSLALGDGQYILFKNHSISDFSASNFQLGLSLAGMTLTFDDEFNTLSLYNSSTGQGTWRTEYGWGGTGTLSSHTLGDVNGEQEIYVDPSFAGTSSTALGLNPFSVSNGILTITASAINNSAISADLWGYKYTSGLLTTAKSFTQEYGYFEMRAELPSGQGVWPAFWLLPTDDTVPTELDIMESVGDSSTVYESVHTGQSGTAVATGAETKVDASSDGFHTYGLLWSPTELDFYVDGTEVYSEATPSDMHKSFYILIDLALGGSWAGAVPSNFTSASMEIDYVRAYEFGSSLTSSTSSTTTSSGSTTSSSSASTTSSGSTTSAGATTGSSTSSTTTSPTTGSSSTSSTSTNAATKVLTATSTSQNFYVTSTNTLINVLANSHDSVQSTVSWTLQKGITSLTLLGTANLTGIGNNDGDRIIGNSGHDTIIGGTGSDYLDPGTGSSSTLTGGGGNDTFYFEKAVYKDTITDFSASDGDLINVHSLNGYSHSLVQSGSNAILEFSNEASITLLGVTTSALSSHITW